MRQRFRRSRRLLPVAVAATGRQIGFIFPVGNMQGYFNLKGYWELAAENLPSVRTKELRDMRSKR